MVASLLFPLISFHVFPEPEYELESAASRCKISPSVTMLATSNPKSVIGSKTFVTETVKAFSKSEVPSLTLT